MSICGHDRRYGDDLRDSRKPHQSGAFFRHGEHWPGSATSYGSLREITHWRAAVGRRGFGGEFLRLLRIQLTIQSNSSGDV